MAFDPTIESESKMRDPAYVDDVDSGKEVRIQIPQTANLMLIFL